MGYRHTPRRRGTLREAAALVHAHRAIPAKPEARSRIGDEDALADICRFRYVRTMDGFTVIAEATRRRILDRLRVAECDVSTLATDLKVSQPVVSKHLRILRTAGVVATRPEGQRRFYRLDEDPLPDVLRWVAPYAQMWSASLDRMAEALDDEEKK